MINILKQLILRFQEEGLPSDLKHRDIDLKPLFETRNAVVIVGPRRAGKTYLMFQIIQQSELSLRNIIYINFKGNVLIDFTPKNFEDILTAYKELYRSEKLVLFLDELHIVPQWEKFVRKLLDKRFKVELEIDSLFVHPFTQGKTIAHDLLQLKSNIHRFLTFHQIVAHHAHVFVLQIVAMVQIQPGKILEAQQNFGAHTGH